MKVERQDESERYEERHKNRAMLKKRARKCPEALRLSHSRGAAGLSFGEEMN